MLGVVEHELRLAEAEIGKYEDVIAIGAVGILFLLIGRATGIYYFSLIGALGLAAGLLKALK